MASFSSHTQIISRGSGRSAIAAAAYRAGEELKNEWDGKIHDYTYRKDVIYTEILTPENAPDWMRDRFLLWNGAQKPEKRKDAQLAREIRFNLPHELSREQQIEVARKHARGFTKMGMVADLCIHDKGDGNPHAHIMLTTRIIEGQDFGKKCREWNNRENVEKWREQLATLTNEALERYGHPDRVDPRSYEEQGLDKTATVHLSRYAYELEQQGIATYKGDINRAIKAENRYREEAKRVIAQIDKAIEQERRQLEAEKIKAEQPTKSVDFEDRYKHHIPQHTTQTDQETERQLTYRERYEQDTHRYHKREKAGQGKNMKEESPPLTVGERYKQAMERRLVRDPDRPNRNYRKPADRYKEAMERKKPSLHDIIEETKRKLEEEKRHHEPEQHHKDKDNGRER